MDHTQLDTTKRYYQVGETRRREAVDRVTAMQFDRHGNRIWRQAKALLDSEHARRAVGEVVVPFGVCAEPSNVKAGGHACPYRFRCAGCDHFRTDVSYLPDLHAYLDDLLRNREKLLASNRYRRLGARRGDAIDRGDHPHPPADRPHHHRTGRPHPGRPRPDRTRRRRRPPPPRRHARHAHASGRPPPDLRPGSNPMTAHRPNRSNGRRPPGRHRPPPANASSRPSEDTTGNGGDSHRQRHRPPRRRRPHIPLPAPRPARTGPRRRGRTTHHARRRADGQPGITAGRPARRAGTHQPAHRRGSDNWRNACPSDIGEQSLARIRTRRARRHRPTPSCRSPTSNNKPSTCVCNSRNATRTSPPPAPRTANS